MIHILVLVCVFQCFLMASIRIPAEGVQMFEMSHAHKTVVFTLFLTISELERLKQMIYIYIYIYVYTPGATPPRGRPADHKYLSICIYITSLQKHTMCFVSTFFGSHDFQNPPPRLPLNPLGTRWTPGNEGIDPTFHQFMGWFSGFLPKLQEKVGELLVFKNLGTSLQHLFSRRRNSYVPKSRLH